MCNIFYILTPVLGPVLRFIYNLVNNYGLAIILFSIVIKLILFPLSIKQYKSTAAMKKIQPELNKLQKKYGNDKEKLQKEQMALYEKYGINPMAGCLPTLIQMPILFALYRVIMMPLTYISGISEDKVTAVAEVLKLDTKTLAANQIKLTEMLNNSATMEKVKDIIPSFSQIDFSFLGLNLSETPHFGVPKSAAEAALWIIPILAGVTSLLSSIAMNKMSGIPQSDGSQNSQMKAMTYMMPLMSVYFCFILPAGMGIYWIINNVIAIAQQFVLNKIMFKDSDVIEGSVVKK
ncbi:MAG: YidC/Oxa1 family membrane protein insertase [Clostridia bacterium]|nr:YidC/Oxa1 family membrane protein insertase [Clostridia bacterium]